MQSLYLYPKWLNHFSSKRFSGDMKVLFYMAWWWFDALQFSQIKLSAIVLYIELLSSYDIWLLVQILENSRTTQGCYNVVNSSLVYQDCFVAAKGEGSFVFVSKQPLEMWLTSPRYNCFQLIRMIPSLGNESVLLLQTRVTYRGKWVKE